MLIDITECAFLSYIVHICILALLYKICSRYFSRCVNTIEGISTERRHSPFLISTDFSDFKPRGRIIHTA